MYLGIGDKWPKGVLTVYLILAIIGTFVFSTGEAFRITDSSKAIPGSNRYVSSMLHAVDWLAEGAPVLRKAHRNSNLHLRNCLIRAYTLAGIISIAVLSDKSIYKIKKYNNSVTANYLVPLKLLI